MELHTSCRKNDCGNCQKNRGEEEEFSHTGIFDAGYDNGSETDRSGECLRGLRTHYDRENAAFSKHRDGSGYRGLSDHDDNSRLFPAERICCRDRRLNAAGCFYYCHGGAGVRSAAVDSAAVSGKVRTRGRQRFHWRFASPGIFSFAGEPVVGVNAVKDSYEEILLKKPLEIPVTGGGAEMQEFGEFASGDAWMLPDGGECLCFMFPRENDANFSFGFSIGCSCGEVVRAFLILVRGYLFFLHSVEVVTEGAAGHA